MRRQPLSMRARLLIAAATLLVLFLGATGLVLDQAFRSSVEGSAREQLRLHVHALLGAAELTDHGMAVPGVLPEPRFNQPRSGLYGLVFDADGRLVWSSRSVAGTPLAHARARERADETLEGLTMPGLAPGEMRFGSVTLPGIAPLYRYALGVLWEGPERVEARYTFVALMAQAPFLAETRAFRASLFAGLGGAALALLIAQLVVFARALAPLTRMSEAIGRIERGESERLDGDYPAELQRLAANLNLLIDHERARQQRYRNTLEDLAHSLKTPLAVLRNALSDERLGNAAAHDVREQVERMDAIVRYQLERARFGGHPLRAVRTRLAPVVEKTLRGLERVYLDKGVSATSRIDPDLAVPMDEGDLYDLVGNLAENAFKYGRSRVIVDTAAADGGFELRFADDGPGIPATLRRAVLHRGARADTATTGEGIGLAVVAELVAAYGGSIRIEDSALGGAAVVVWLPRPQASWPRLGRSSTSAPSGAQR